MIGARPSECVINPEQMRQRRPSEPINIFNPEHTESKQLVVTYHPDGGEGKPVHVVRQRRPSEPMVMYNPGPEERGESMHRPMTRQRCLLKPDSNATTPRDWQVFPPGMVQESTLRLPGNATASAGGAGDEARRPSRRSAMDEDLMKNVPTVGIASLDGADARAPPHERGSESWALALGQSASADEHVGTSTLNLLPSTGFSLGAGPHLDLHDNISSCDTGRAGTKETPSRPNTTRLFVRSEEGSHQLERRPSKILVATARAIASKVDPFQATVMLSGAMLACCAGMVNVICFLGLGTFVSHATGTLSRTGLSVADGAWAEVGLSLLLIFCFTVGAAVCGCLIAKNHVNLDDPLYGVALLGNSALLVLAAVTTETPAAPFLAATACGLQNGMATSYSGAVIRTTHVTGLFTDLGLIVGRMVVSHTRRQYNRVCHLDAGVNPWEELQKFVLLLVLAFSFLCGCVLGACLFDATGLSGLFVPAVVTGLAGLYYSAYRWFCPQKPLHRVSTYGEVAPHVKRAFASVDGAMVWPRKSEILRGAGARTGSDGGEDRELGGVLPGDANSDMSMSSEDSEAHPEEFVTTIKLSIPGIPRQPSKPPDVAPHPLPAGIHAPPPVCASTANRIVAALDKLEAAFNDLAVECLDRTDVLEACEAHRALRGKVAHLVR